MHGRKSRLSWLTKLVVDACHAKETRLERFYRRTQEALDKELPRSEQRRLGWEIRREEGGIQRFYYVHIPVGTNCAVAAVRDGVWGWRIVGHKTEGVPIDLVHPMHLIRNGRLLKRVAEIIAYRPERIPRRLEYGMFSNYLITPSYLVDK